MVTRLISIAQRKDLRAQAHHLNPTVMVGQSGLTDAVVKEVDAALKAHGLIKIRVFGDDRELRQHCLTEICERLNAAPVQHIGKLLVVWRPKPVKETRRLEWQNDEETPRSSKTTRRRSSSREVVVKLPPKKSDDAFARVRVKRVSVLPHQRVTAGGLVKRQKIRHSKKEVQ
jgi:putative YhbY family RNA-binding protein